MLRGCSPLPLTPLPPPAPCGHITSKTKRPSTPRALSHCCSPDRDGSFWKSALLSLPRGPKCTGACRSHRTADVAWSPLILSLLRGPCGQTTVCVPRACHRACHSARHRVNAPYTNPPNNPGCGFNSHDRGCLEDVHFRPSSRLQAFLTNSKVSLALRPKRKNSLCPLQELQSLRDPAPLPQVTPTPLISISITACLYMVLCPPRPAPRRAVTSKHPALSPVLGTGQLSASAQ